MQALVDQIIVDTDAPAAPSTNDDAQKGEGSEPSVPSTTSLASECSIFDGLVERGVWLMRIVLVGGSFRTSSLPNRCIFYVTGGCFGSVDSFDC